MEGVSGILDKLPSLDCGECGYETCKEMAEAITGGTATFQQCVVLSTEKTVSLKIGGVDVPLGNFVQNFIKGTVIGMLSSLKKTDIRVGDVIELKIRVEEDDL